MEALTVAADGRSTASPIPYWIVAMGGALLGLASVVLCASDAGEWSIFIHYDFEAGQISDVIVALTFIALVLSGLLLAGGWTWLCVRGDAGLGAVLGSLALTAGWIFGGGVGGGGGSVVGDPEGGVSFVGVGGTTISSLGLLVCVVAHLSTLQRLVLRRVRFAALLAMSGMAAQLLAFTTAHERPALLERVLVRAGLGCMALFGFALAIGAVSVSRARMRPA